MSNGTYRTRTSTTSSSISDWELPTPEGRETEKETNFSPLYQEPEIIAKDPGLSAGGQDEEDPLVGFQDEHQEEPREEKPKFSLSTLTANTQKKKLAFGGLLFLLLALLLIIPAVILSADRNKAEIRLKAPGAVSVQELQVDVSQPIPLVGVQLSVKKSALPKYTTLNPSAVQCRFLNHKWGNTMVASIHEVEESETTRSFVLNGTLAPPHNEGEALDPTSPLHATIKDVTQTYATVAWQVLTQQTTFLGKYNCGIQMEAIPFDRKAFAMKHTEIVLGKLDMSSLWGSPKPRAQPSPTLVTTTGPKKNKHHYTTSSWTPILIAEDPHANLDYHDGDDTIFSEEDESAPPLTMAPTGVASTSAPTSALASTSNKTSNEAPVFTVPYHKDPATDTHTNAPMVYTPSQAGHTSASPTTSKKSFIVVHELSTDGLVLGIQLCLPQTIFDSIDTIQVFLPSINAQVKSSANNPNTPPLQLSVEKMNLDLDSHSNGQDYALATVGCGNKEDDSSCPWYNPLVSLISDTLQHSHDQKAVVTIYIDASKSFLEQMVGSVHQIKLYRLQMKHGFGLQNSRGRRNLQMGAVDCIHAQGPLFGDLFELNWCMNLQYSKGIVIDGSLNFYGYGGAISTDLEWQETNDGVLRLDGSATVALQMSEDDQDTKMALQGSAAVDPDNLSVAIHVNNTADWWPFLVVLEASVHYDDPADAVIVMLNNGRFELDGEQYLAGTGEIRVDNPSSKITMVVNDPRLDMAMDGNIIEGGDGLQATWRILYDEENIVTGDSSLVLPTANCDDDYFLTHYGSGVLDLLSNPCSGNQGFQLQMESDGRLTTKVDAVLTSDYAKMRQASISWDKEDIADVTMDLAWKFHDDDWEIDLEFEEDTQDHKVTFSLVTKGGGPTFRADSQSSIQIAGKKIFTSGLTLKEDTRYNTLEIDLFGEARDKEYSMAVDMKRNPSYNKEQLLIQGASFLLDDRTIWKATGSLELEQNDPYAQYLRYQGILALDGEVLDRNFDLNVEGKLSNSESAALEYKGDSSLTVDDDLLWSESANLAILAIEEDETCRGTLEMRPTSFQADVQMDAALVCDWVDALDTFSCQLLQMQLSYTEIPLTDSTGDMVLNLPEGTLSLNMRDDYEQDGEGYVVSMSGNFDSDNYILTGKVNDLKSYWNGEATMDGAGEAVLNIGNFSVSYILEDAISETLMGLEHGGLAFTSDEYDEYMETMDIRLNNMRMAMAGDPWVHGNVHFNLDTIQSTMSIAMDNNTTKLPMEFDFTIGFGDNDEMYMGLNVISSPPPSPPTPPAVEESMAPTAAPTVSDDNAIVAPTAVPTVLDHNAVTIPATSEEEEAPGSAPVDEDFATVTINTTILIYNLEGLNATALLGDPETLAILQEAFQDFVKDLLLSLEGEVSSVSVSKSQRNGQRFLEVALLDEKTTVHKIVDVDCPKDQPLPTPNATCQTILGGYELAVMDEDPEVVRVKYVQETTQALEEGKLQESLQAIDPQFPVAVIGPVADETNRAETSIPMLTQAPAPEKSASRDPGVSLALVGAIWALGLLLVGL